MTKEELEKEVEEYLEKEHCKSVCTCDEIEECKKGIRIKCMSFNCRKELIVNFAEPREKRIKHLEESLLDVAEKSVRKIAELEKENKELKCFIRDLIYENHNLCFHFNNTTCLFNSDYRNRAEELTGEKL